MVGAELGSAVVGQQHEEQRAEHTALWGTCAQLLWDYCVECRVEVNEQHSNIGVFIF